jgi:glycerol-3-phosphate dehydrogenase
LHLINMPLAPNPRPSLEAQHFHVVVIGGGINGVAVARQCALAGKRTLLVEQNDFASGVTSRSTRIIHGGLRYLEHGELDLVRESLRERERLLREHSHLVHPMQFLLLLNETSQHSALKIRAGLWLYRRLGGNLAGQHSPEMDLKEFERSLDSGHRWSFFNYEDAQCEFPERLVAEWLGQAVEAGAVVRNHTEALAIDVANGRCKGLLLRDLTSSKEWRVDAGWIINCTGPWVDRICQRSSIRMAQPLLGGVRGSHLVLQRFPGAPTTALYTEAEDGRPVFVLPWNDQILVGTTEIADSGDPGKTAPSPDEIAYLLATVGELFPKARISEQTVKHAFAGIRPLPYSPKSQPSTVTRRHVLRDHAPDGAARMISVIGGKLTTAASVARECARKIGLKVSQPSAIGRASGPALDPLLDDAVLEIARIGSVREESARGILEWHGKRAADIARMALVSAELRTPICPHTCHVIAEVVEAYRREWAVTLADVLLRRVPVALGPCWSEACSRDAAVRIGTVMGWNEHTVRTNLEAFESERATFLHPVSRTQSALKSAAH